LYAAQFKNAMQKDIPNYDELLADGEIGPITDWLTDKVHRHGAVKKPLELLEEATGESLNGNHLAEYLEAKYAKIYQLD
ncbi:MAG: carboxypeptidase M32, partial [Planococcus sp. (in: firmicutes)]|nr:carboxypeptidase M32 [Planococcus sp. (in: firmicutes)]